MGSRAFASTARALPVQNAPNLVYLNLEKLVIVNLARDSLTTTDLG
jgi:hypothetical protein